jgi:hypothetical protein
VFGCARQGVYKVFSCSRQELFNFWLCSARRLSGLQLCPAAGWPILVVLGRELVNFYYVRQGFGQV